MRRPLLAAFALALIASGFRPAPGLGQEPTYSIRGTVVTSTGRPAASVWVVVEREGQDGGRTLTADDGRYYLSRLRPGAYRILVRRAEATIYRAQIRLPNDAVHDIVLRP